MTGLERRYRWLLWAYPRGYRRRYGDEMVTTLLEMAAPGQARPARADVVDLIRDGLRQRSGCRPGVRSRCPRPCCAR